MRDEALATAIARAGNVVVAAQLARTIDERNETRVVWLRPLPEIESAAAGTGHVNIATGFDGVARLLLLRQASDEGQAFWAMAIETIRVAMRVKSDSLRELPEALQIGARTIPINIDGDEVPLGPQSDGAHFERLRPARLILDYVGPAGSFAPQTYSFSDMLEGRVSAENLRGKYVLIGATAATLGDRLATPFAHTESAVATQPAELMSGVKILANSLHTILRERFYKEVPDWLTALFAALAAAAVCFSLTVSLGRREAIKQILVMIGLASIAGLICYVSFSRWLILLSVVPLIVSGSTAALLTLLHRSLVHASGSRTVRTRQGGLHRSDERPRWSLRVCGWRDALPRRTGFDEPGIPGQPAARAAIGRGAASRVDAYAARRCANNRRKQCAIAGADQRREVSRRPLLPAERAHDRSAAVARAPGRYRTALTALLAAPERRATISFDQRGDGNPVPLSIPRQCAGVGKCPDPGSGTGSRPCHHDRLSAAPHSSRRAMVRRADRNARFGA
jgi:CHASE2 domain-containing sensor protein